MTTTYIGGLSVGELLPGISAPLFAAFAGLQAQVDALLAFGATVQLDLSAQISLSLQITASLEAALALGLEPPSLAVQIAIVADALIAIELQLALILDLINLFGVPGIHAWHYNGRADTLGSDMTTELSGGLPAGGGPAEVIDALIIATSAPATWNAIQAIFKTAP